MPLSYSQLQCYRRCPKQYEFAFVKKVPRQISRGESFGSSIHLTLKKWSEREMKAAGKTVHVHQIALFTDDQRHTIDQRLDLTALKTLWRECFIAEGYDSRMAQDAALLQGEQALEHFFAWWQREPRSVLACEKGFTVEQAARADKPAVSISGRFDRVEHTPAGLRIIDYKSSAPRQQIEIDTDLQLSIYAAAAQELWNEPVAELVLLFIGEEGIVEGKTTRNASQIKDAWTIIQSLAARMEAKDFRATPSVAVCRACPYREVCTARAI